MNSSVNRKEEFCCLITGASMGIGEQLAYECSRKGFRVLLTARSESLLEKVTERCITEGARSANFICADMSKSVDVKKVSERTKSLFAGKLHLLILNHKGIQKVFLWTGSDENLDYLSQTMTTDFFSYASLASYCLPLLEGNGGVITAVSSTVSDLPVPSMIAYGAAKAAISGFFHGLRQDLAMRKSDVSVTVCMLGTIDTPGFHGDMDKGFYKNYAQMAGQLSMPEDAAKAIVAASLKRDATMWFPWLLQRTIALIRGLPFGLGILEYFSSKVLEPTSR